MKRKLTEPVVHEIADDIDAAGVKVTPSLILQRNDNSGSYESVYKYLQSWKPPEGTEENVTFPPEFGPTLEAFGTRVYRAAFAKARAAADVPLKAALAQAADFSSDAATAVAAADAAYQERDEAKRDAASLAGELFMAKALIASLNAKHGKKARPKKASPGTAG